MFRSILHVWSLAYHGSSRARRSASSSPRDGPIRIVGSFAVRSTAIGRRLHFEQISLSARYPSGRAPFRLARIRSIWPPSIVATWPQRHVTRRFAPKRTRSHVVSIRFAPMQNRKRTKSNKAIDDRRAVWPRARPMQIRGAIWNDERTSTVGNGLRKMRRRWSHPAPARGGDHTPRRAMRHVPRCWKAADRGRQRGDRVHPKPAASEESIGFVVARRRSPPPWSSKSGRNARLLSEDGLVIPARYPP